MEFIEYVNFPTLGNFCLILCGEGFSQNSQCQIKNSSVCKINWLANPILFVAVLLSGLERPHSIQCAASCKAAFLKVLGNPGQWAG